MKLVAETNSGPGSISGTRKQRDSPLQAHPKTPSGVLVPVAAVIAVVGTVSLFLMDFGPWNSPPGDGHAAVVYRTGATALPSAPTPRAAF